MAASWPLNRAVALSMAFGPAAGLEVVDRLTAEPLLKSYHLLPTVRGDLLSERCPVIALRLLNHSGPGQDERFVVPNFAVQIARIEKGLIEPKLSVGNLEVERDFLDVDDVIDRAGTVSASSWRKIAVSRSRSIGLGSNAWASKTTN